MSLSTNFGTAVHVTETAFTAITTSAVKLLGIMFNGTATGKIDGIYNCKSTASAASGTLVAGPIICYATVAGATANPAVYYPFPAYLTNGAVIDVGGSADPRVTLFIDPEGISTT